MKIIKSTLIALAACLLLSTSVIAREHGGWHGGGWHGDGGWHGEHHHHGGSVFFFGIGPGLYYPINYQCTIVPDSEDEFGNIIPAHRECW